MAKARKKKTTAKPRPAETSSFALAPGWVAAETLLFPAAMLLLLFVVLARFADAGSANMQIGVFVAFVAIRLPLLVYTLWRDRRILLGKDELRVPVVGVFQLRPWTIPFDELVSVGENRMSGGSTRIVLKLRGGRTRRFAASVVRDRTQLIKAIERRVHGAQD